MGNASCTAEAHVPNVTCSPDARPTAAIGAMCGVSTGDELLDKKYLNVQLLAGARDGELAVVREALRGGANTETRQPMRIIAGPRRDPAAPSSIPAGAKPKPKRSRGPTPLMLACKSGSVECVRALLNARAKLTAKDEDNMQPLHFAAESGEFEVVKLLLLSRAKPADLDSDGRDAADHVPQDCRKGWSAVEAKNWAALLASDNTENAEEKTVLVRYLPMVKDGMPLLIHEGSKSYRVDATRGIRYRKSKSMDDRDPDIRAPEYKSKVEGEDEGDGWLKVEVKEGQDDEDSEEADDAVDDNDLIGMKDAAGTVLSMQAPAAAVARGTPGAMRQPAVAAASAVPQVASGVRKV